MASITRASVTIGSSRQLTEKDIVSLSLQQEVGAHHHFQIRLKRDARQGLFQEKAKEWIGQSATICFATNQGDPLQAVNLPERFKGVVTNVGISVRAGQTDLVINGQSPTILLEDLPRSLSFTDMPTTQIVDKVLEAYESVFPKAPKVAPQIQTANLPYTVQYCESNFAFLVRLAERFGEWFYYDGLQLYFGATPGSGEPLKLDFSNHKLVDFDLSIRTRPAQATLQAYDYLTHEAKQAVVPKKIATNASGSAALEASDRLFGKAAVDTLTTNTDEETLNDLAARREQVLADDIVIASGSSHNPALSLGCVVEVTDESVTEKYGTYVVTSLSHYFGQGGDYHNSFQAIPKEVTTPMLMTIARAPSCEPQLAEVKDVADEDKLGRVKVQLLWQEEGETTPWCRIASPYTGKDKGFYFVPEVGDQVLVAFEGNDPERPYVLSGMYHGKAAPQWYEDDNHFKGFKTKGENQLKMDDKNESLMLYAPSEMMLYAGSKLTLNTGGKEDSQINIDTGDGTITLTAKCINLVAKEQILLDSEKEIEATAESVVDIVSGGDISLEAKGSLDVMANQAIIESKGANELKGATVDVKGSGPVTVKGAIIKLN